MQDYYSASDYLFSQGGRQIIVSRLEESGVHVMTVDEIREWCEQNSKPKTSELVDWLREGF